MIGLDTNVLVRYIVEDDAEQAALARQLIETVCSSTKPAQISLIMLCELVWVLDLAYSCNRDQISTVLENVLLTECFDVAFHDLAWLALHDYRATHADYADCLISHLNHARGSETTYTFDKKAAKLPLNTLLVSSSVCE